MELEVMLKNGDSIIIKDIKVEDIFVTENLIRFGDKALVNLESFMCYQFKEAK